MRIQSISFGTLLKKVFSSGAPDRNRTCYQEFRSPRLSIELQAHDINSSDISCLAL